MAFTQWPGLSDPKDINALTAAIEAYVDDATALLNAKLATALGGAQIQTGSFVSVIGTTAVDTTVTFPVAFGGVPTVFCSIIDTAVPVYGTRVDRWGNATADTTGVGTTSQFFFRSTRDSGSGTIRVNWIAIGPPA